jgi:predicted dehydrogenase
MRTLRVGILGSSFGGKVHAPAFAAHERFELIAIASPTHAEAVAKERNIPQSYASLEEMLEAARLDVLSIAAPPFAHYDAVRAALKRGLHVLCEKPFTMNAAEAEELVALAKSAGTACILAHEFRFLPTRLALHELLANGHLGPVRLIETAVQSGFLRRDVRRPRGWWFSREQGGGVAGAWLSHAVDSVNWLAGRAPLRACGYIRTANVEREDAEGKFLSTVDDGAFATVDYGESLIAQIQADGTLRVNAYTLSIHGEKRSAVATGKTPHAQQLFTIDDDETAEWNCAPIPRAALASIHESVPAFAAMLDAFADAIDGKPHLAATFADGLATQRVLAAIGYGTG